MPCDGRALALEGMVMRSGVGGSTTAPIPPLLNSPDQYRYLIRGEGDKQEGGLRPVREDG
jgi:hypothetical protein